MKIAQLFGMTLILVPLASPQAFADDGGWYLGFNAGQSRAKIDDSRIADDLGIDGFATTAIDNEDPKCPFKSFGGYEFNRYFALESGIFDLGQFGFRADTLPPGSLHGQAKIIGLNLDAVGSIPIGDQFSLFARAGGIYERT